jgi:alpha-L-fucosidase
MKNIFSLYQKFRSSILLIVLLMLIRCNAIGESIDTTLIATQKEKQIIRLAANITPSARQLRWQELEFIAFFHFGINTFTNREWGDGKEDPSLFNPTSLDAFQWVETCKKAGIKQVILTAKHHDGFCLWPSKFTEHSVKSSPWKDGKGDVMREVSEACHKLNMGFGVYLSPWDRNCPFYGDSPKYNDYFVNQLTELLTGYGQIDEVWFDGACGEGPNGKKQIYDWERYYKLIRNLQPSAVIAIMGPDVRWVGTESGYGRETEWSVLPIDAQSQDQIAADSQKDEIYVPQGDMRKQDLGSRAIIRNASRFVWYPSETDVSIRPGWFYHSSEDGKVKSPEKLLDIYFSSIGRNSVLLLNIPPDTRGLINENDLKSLFGLKSLIDKIFSVNYAQTATLSSGVGKITQITDDNSSTYWTTAHEKERETITIKLKEPTVVNVLSLQENIRIGQRVEKFSFEYFDGSTWKTLTNGTTIGYKRLLRFVPIKAQQFRLNIEASRLNPTLSEIGLFYSN